MKQFKRIYAEITNVCNLSCSFCPKQNRPPKFVTVSEFEHIAESISPFTDYVYLHVKGEPLLHPNLSSILEICRKYSLQVNLTTNGTKLKETRDILYHSPSLRQINISLHSFERIESNRFSELDQYLETIFETAKYLRDYTNTISAFRLWNLAKNNLTAEGRKRNSYVLEKIEQAFCLNYSLLETAQNIKLDKQIYLNYDYEFVWPSLSAPFIGESGYCYGLKTQLGILADGSVIPCCLDGDGVITLGNIFDESLSEILNKERSINISTSFAKRQAVEELCQKCGYRERFHAMTK